MDYENENFDDYSMDDTMDILDDPYDYMLEQQELEDFAQDGCFENMEPNGDGTWS